MFAPQHAVAADFADGVPADEFVVRVWAVAGFGILAPGSAIAMAIAGASASLWHGGRFGPFQGGYHRGLGLPVHGVELMFYGAGFQPAGKFRPEGAD